MNTRLSALIFVLSAALCMGAGDPPVSEEPKIPTVDLSKLREDKSLWLGKEIRFTLQLEAELETWRAWVTRFGVEDYQAYSVWADSAFLWNLEDFHNTTPHIFARRGSLPQQKLARRARYERFEVRAVVRSIFLDEPWIELLEVRSLKQRMSQGTVIHGERAVKLMGENHYDLALGELERARAGRLSKVADAELARLEEQCRANLRRD